MTAAAFRSAAPPRTHEQFGPYIDRMKQGEESVLWPGSCSLYAVTSGTSSSTGKHLPVTGAMLRHFRQAGLDALLYSIVRVGHSAVFRGRHLFLGGVSTLAPLDAAKEPPALAGDISGITTLNLPR